MIRSATKPSTRPIEPKPDEKEESGTTISPTTPEGTPVPEKKRTFAENFVRYWKNIAHDYKDVCVETYKEAKEKPKKATIYLIILGLLGYLLKTNPSERHFNERVITDRLELDLVGMPIRSVKAEKHIRSLAKLQCSGQVRYQSFGFFSVIWKHDIDKRLGIFDSQCSYLRPLLTEIPERVVDIGFANRWWVSKQNMIDFDINEKEWEEKIETNVTGSEKLGM